MKLPEVNIVPCCKNCLRFRVDFTVFIGVSFLDLMGGAMDRRTNFLVGAAPANVACHGGVDIRIAGIGVFIEQGDGGHDLP